MPTPRRKTPKGASEVGRLAVQDRAFFDRLLENPLAAMQEKEQAGILKLTKTDRDYVVRVIEARRRNPRARNPGEVWEAFHRAAEIMPEDWPEMWVAAFELWMHPLGPETYRRR
jgi:hypothetical protein